MQDAPTEDAGAGDPLVFLPQHDRFTDARLMGEGGFGVVFDVHDRERAERVALKLLKRTSGRDVDRFKREFRELSELTHESLPLLYELFVEDGRWFFTMELIEGESVRAFAGWASGAVAASTEGSVVAAKLATGADASAVLASRPFDPRRVESVAHQLSAVLAFIHGVGFVHGDIKPSNVLVRPNGRIVLLDFGLVASDQEARGGFVGTAAHAAPELLAAHVVSSAQDLYSFGSLIFELATGAPPFPGLGLQPMLDKSRRDAPSLSVLAPELSPELCDRVARWLSRDPQDRGALGLVAEGDSDRFIGRGAELGRLRAAYGEATAGRSVAVVVEGPSGYGKTALVEHFLDALRSVESPPLQLRSKASPREHLPFNAIDGALSQLGSLDLSPPTSTRTDLAQHLKERLRQRAGGATVVVWIDDCHWADADSLIILEEWLVPPRLRSLLLILSQRPFESGYSRVVLPSLAETIHVGPMSREETAMIARSAGLGDEAANAVAARAKGQPLFARELCHGASVSSVCAPDLVSERAQGLTPFELTLLRVVCLSQTPLPTSRLSLLAPNARVSRSLERMSRIGLLRRSNHSTNNAYVPFHDVVRETVLRGLEPESLPSLHRRLVELLDAGDERELPALIEHLRGAGRPSEAASLSIRAARTATRAGAHAQAAEFLAQALRLDPAGSADDALAEELLVALERAQLTLAAAHQSLAIARAAPPGSARHQRFSVRAAKLFLACGAMTEGHRVLAYLCQQLQVPWPRTELETFARILLETRRGASPPVVHVDSPLRRELISAVADGLSLIDAPRGYLFQLRALADARRVGEPIGLAVALLRDARYASSRGGSATAHVQGRLDEVRALFPAGLPPHLAAYVLFVEALLDHQTLSSRRAADRLLVAEQAFAALPGVDPSALGIVGLIAGHCLQKIGDLPRLRLQVERLAREAERRNDTFLLATARFGGTRGWLADDAPEIPRYLLRKITWPDDPGAFHIQHWLRAETEVETSLYEGDPVGGWQRVGPVRRQLLFSLVRRNNVVRMSCDYLFGRAVLGVRARSPRVLGIQDWLAFEWVLRQLTQDASPAARLRAEMLRASSAFIGGAPQRARRSLERALAMSRALGYELTEAIVGHVLVKHWGVGGTLPARTAALLAAQGVVAPDRFVEVELPGM